jgi:cytochrome b
MKIWDLPMRLFHWALVVLVVGLWWTAQVGNLQLHKVFGLLVLGLLVFRLLWGMVGSSTAQFAKFVRGPRAVLAYLKDLNSDNTAPSLGHNPLGGWSVLGLITILMTEVCLGLFAQDVDGIESGPLSHFVSYDAADTARHWHHLIFNGILALVGFHIAAIFFYLLIKRDNLIGPMITGRRLNVPDSKEVIFAPLLTFIICLIIAAGFAWWVSLGCPLGK